MAEAKKLSEVELKADPLSPEEVPQEVPEQGGTYIPLLPFTTFAFQLPADLADCWEVFDHVDQNSGAETQRLRLRFDLEHPLTVFGGPKSGALFTTTVSSVPRPRGKDKTPVADLYYLVRECLGDLTPIRSNRDYVNVVNKHAGEVVYLELGGSARCDKERVRYIFTENPEDASNPLTIEDPDGTHGCGQRYYSRQIPRTENGDPVERLACGTCGAALRVFQQIERFKKRPKA